MHYLMAILLFNNFFLVGCETPQTMRSYPAIDRIELSAKEGVPMHYPGLQQVVAFQDYIISGSKPEGNAGFESLMKMGVKTIICVDGVTPDVQTATSLGIKTIHIPLKYEAPTQTQILDLTTVVSRRNRGKVYIHCHQGKHRSATAAAIVSVALGSMSIEEVKARMHVSQTSEEYIGLWAAVDQAKVIKVFDLLQNEKVYNSRVEPEGMISQMIAMDDAIDHLNRLQDENWTAPKEHPDLVAVAEAGIVADIFRKIQLGNEVNSYPADFETQLVNALHQAKGLEEAFLQNLATTELDMYMQRVEQSCIRCHSLFRK